MSISNSPVCTFFKQRDLSGLITPSLEEMANIASEMERFKGVIWGRKVGIIRYAKNHSER